MRTLIVVGPRGSGKTSLCARAVDCSRALRMRCSGCLERSTRDASGRPYRIEIEDIASGASFLAARRQPDTQTPFEFDSKAFSRARELCVATIRENALPSQGLLPVDTARRVCCIDEIGPLELTDRSGHRDLLEFMLREKPVDWLILTVRPSLKSDLEALLESRGICLGDVEVIEASISDTSESPTAIDAMLNTPPS